MSKGTVSMRANRLTRRIKIGKTVTINKNKSIDTFSLGVTIWPISFQHFITVAVFITEFEPPTKGYVYLVGKTEKT